MAKSGRGIELFEILAQRRAKGKGLARPNWLEAGGDKPGTGTGRLPQAPARTGREIVFALDTAFVLFVAVLILVGTAYVLGYRNGQGEGQNVALSGKAAPVEIRSDVDVTKGIEGKTLQPSFTLSGNEFTLKLRTTQKKTDADLAKLKHEARSLLALPDVRDGSHEIHIFDSGGVYSLGVGLFEKREDPRLVHLQSAFAKIPGPPTSRGVLPYAACSVAQTKDLGTLVPP